MTGVLRSAVHGIVLGTGPQLTVLGILRPLQAPHHLCTHHTRQIGILAVGLLSPAPSRIAEDVHIRCPHGEAVELLILTTVEHPVVVLCPELRAGHVEHLIQQVRVPRRSHSHRLRKYRHVAHIGCPAPPEELLDAEPRDGRTLVEHQLGLLLEGQTTTQIPCPLLGAQAGILIRKCLCRHRKADTRHQHN